ncbi:hypothetical protein C8_101 [Cannes 8 virus]|nr:hypothetical protein C8_101 [Cannes 8 virus]ANB78248.1 hypothetical protein MEL_085b [Melbournevirus]
MQEDIFIFDGKRHISEDGSTIYLGVERWFLDDVAKHLWEEHGESLKWREIGTEGFVAFIDEKKGYIQGELEDISSVQVFSAGTSLPISFKGEKSRGAEEVIVNHLFNVTFC